MNNSSEYKEIMHELKKIRSEIKTINVAIMQKKSFISDDGLFNQAKALVIQNKNASASLLQRKLLIGYARAAQLLEMLEEQGIVGPQIGSKPRKVRL